MKLWEWIDKEELETLKREGMVTERRHPRYPLLILNYSPKAQSLAKWSTTLERCRGLVYEEVTFDIFAIPFSKFWAYNTPAHPETLPENLPKSLPAIYEKVDGSLGIGFFYKGEFIIATRGSFESDQAKWANDWVKRNQFAGPLQDSNTYLFEIVYPEDRKVVKYDYEGLVLLGMITREGEEWPPNSIFAQAINNYLYVRTTKQRYFDGQASDLTFLREKNLNNEEGYVAVWYGHPTIRVKLKFELYQRLHRLYFQTTTDVIWELLKAGGDKADPIRNHLEGADNDLKYWAVGVSLGIIERRLFIANQSKEEFREAMQYCNLQHDLEASEKDRRKAFAFKASQSKNPGLLFLLYDGKFKEYDEQLWKIVRPVPSERYTKVEE